MAAARPPPRPRAVDGDASRPRIHAPPDSTRGRRHECAIRGSIMGPGDGIGRAKKRQFGSMEFGITAARMPQPPRRKHQRRRAVFAQVDGAHADRKPHLQAFTSGDNFPWTGAGRQRAAAPPAHGNNAVDQMKSGTGPAAPDRRLAPCFPRFAPVPHGPYRRPDRDTGAALLFHAHTAHAPGAEGRRGGRPTHPLIIQKGTAPWPRKSCQAPTSPSVTRG